MNDTHREEVFEEEKYLKLFFIQKSWMTRT